MYDTDDRNDPHNPFRRPPAWRWLRACHLVEDNKRPARGRDDDKVREAVRFCRALRRCKDDRAQDRLACKMPVLYQAWLLNQKASLGRSELDARILAGEASQAIARKCLLTEDVVDAYHDVYYCVRNRLHAPDWVMNMAVGRRTHQGLTEADQDVLLKLAATLIATQKVERRLARLHRQEEKARWEVALKAQQALDDLTDLLVQASLPTCGFHKHGGCWRKKRNGKRTDNTTEQTPGSPAPGSPGEACPAGGRVRTA